MDTANERNLGLMELHPEVFAAFPKIHLIHDNVRWQRMYRQVVSAPRTYIHYRGFSKPEVITNDGSSPTYSAGLGGIRTLPVLPSLEP